MMRTTYIGWAIAIAVSAAACGRGAGTANDRAARDASRTDRPAPAANEPVTPTAPADTSARSEPATAGKQAAHAAGHPKSAATGRAQAPAPAPKKEHAQKKEHAPSVTLTGCLARADARSDYTLSSTNATRKAVGTTGKTAGGQSDIDVIAQMQERQAARAYRLRGDRDRMAHYVGAPVRVTGTLDPHSTRPTMHVVSLHAAPGTCGSAHR